MDAGAAKLVAFVALLLLIFGAGVATDRAALSRGGALAAVDAAQQQRGAAVSQQRDAVREHGTSSLSSPPPPSPSPPAALLPVSYTHLRAHETLMNL
eukprot:6013886-Prymnesium_polylepis.1